MIIGVTGLIGSGKDTVADYLCTFHGFKRISFAASLKDAVASIFGWERELLEGSTKTSREWREQPDEWWSNRLSIPNLTPRWVLQHWGTDLCRQHFHDDIWIASVEHKLLNSRDHIVVTDCRFPNEVSAIKKAGGITVRTHRGPNPVWYEYAVALTSGPMHPLYDVAKAKLAEFNVHASEYSSVGITHDYHLDNNGTIDDLHRQIKSVVNL